MKLRINKQNLQWSDAWAGYTERRVRRSLGRIRDRVRSVGVSLTDLNGPRGGEDKRCVVSVRLASGHEIHANAVDQCPYRAVDGAVSRLKRAATERVRRLREHRSRPRPSFT